MVKAQEGIGTNMKKYRTMIILLGVFGVLIGLYFAMQYINKAKTENNQDDIIMVTELGNLAAMEYTNGETTMSFTSSEGVWTVTDNSEFNLDSDIVDTIANELSQVQANRVLEGEDELSAYGLDEPAYTITLTTDAGAEITLHIGNEVDGNYYATTGDKVVVYVIGSSVVDALEFDITVLEAEVVEEETPTQETTENTDEASEQ